MPRQVLSRAGAECDSLELDAAHAFMGLNPFLLVFTEGWGWRDNAVRGTASTADWLDKHHRV